MLKVSEAIGQLVSKALPTTMVESVSVVSSRGRVLAKDIVATIDVPPADNSAMDGYAFCYEHALKADFQLPLGQRIPAGTAPKPLAPFTVARIFTGAEIPAGADTVAMQENCLEHDGLVTVEDRVNATANVRSKGQDIQSGETILKAGTKIRAQEMGLLSSVGVTLIEVFKPLKIAIFSTGDELVEPGELLLSGQIYNSNRSTLIGLIDAMGMLAVDLGTVADNLEATEAVLKKAAVEADIILSAGGVSVGDEDYVKDAVANLGNMDFWRVAIKPGKPLAFGQISGIPFIGLPGNPASVFVTFMILARPFLLASQGLRTLSSHPLKAIAQFDKPAEKREVYLRGRLTNAGAEIFPNQSSGVLSSACWGDIFVKQAIGQSIQVGDLIEVLPYTL